MTHLLFGEAGRNCSACAVCARALGQHADPMSLDCGGICWGCQGEIGAAAGDPVDLAQVRVEAAQGLRPDWCEKVPKVSNARTRRSLLVDHAPSEA
ncbi:hypothetical protein G7047_10770 [Diaphorobacter sp. HDW4A]|uniref:hypothetical protein n=1 Tax=Diaphorobacter sp. HDW4A TaxID=2714924 RepID=UPI0014095B56|nr:hypothetical protein [Diaphorobacter sp. HDW4A]QIL78473.1 hypothetical protein G7047_10770 [Diaphorobacter sp. HDW4A]